MPGELQINSIPEGWHCKIRVIPYVVAPDSSVRQVTDIRIKSRVLAERYRGNTDDLRHGDYSIGRFRPLYAGAREICMRNRENLIGPVLPAGVGSLPKVRRMIANQLCPTFEEFVAMSDDEHFAHFQSLIETFSTGSLQIVGVDLVNAVRDSRGGAYRNPTLNREVRDQPSPRRLLEQVQEQLTTQLREHNGDLKMLADFRLQGFVRFDTFWERARGLGILIHDTEGYRVDLVDYTCLPNRRYRARVRVQLFDHFGLDEADVRIDRPGQAPIHMQLAPLGFISWFYLQRVRNFRPVKVITENFYEIDGEY